MDEYKKYTDYQNERGMNCPILNNNLQNQTYYIENSVKSGAFHIPTLNLKNIFIKKLHKGLDYSSHS